MKMKQIKAIILAGVLACSAPTAVMASESSVEEIVSESGIDELLSDPDKVTDIIIYVKDLVDEQQISESDISEGINLASDHFGIQLDESEKESLTKLAKKLVDMDLDEEQLRSNVKKAYDTLDSLGVEKEDVKNILEKAVSFIKSLLD